MNKSSLGAGHSKREFWSRHIEAWKSSGGTQADYCRKNDLNKHTFLYWKSKLQQDGIAPLLLPVSIQQERKESGRFNSGVSFLVQDYKIQLDVGFNCDTLMKLIDTLESR